MRAGDLVAEPLVIHRIGTPAERRAKVEALFDRAGLPTGSLGRYPHEFSGGQRQRLCIARALTLGPKLLVADESVSALDVSVQARVLALLRELKESLGVATLFISHDMAVVDSVADRVAVMYLGQIVEAGTRAQVFGDPRHPYNPPPDRGGPGPRPHPCPPAPPPHGDRGAEPDARQGRPARPRGAAGRRGGPSRGGGGVSVPQHARAVVIGGGVSGCSVAYHLARSAGTWCCSSDASSPRDHLARGGARGAAARQPQPHPPRALLAELYAYLLAFVK
jgi:hypothetical protein